MLNDRKFNRKVDLKNNLSSPHSFDIWIDDLVKFKETVFPTSTLGMSIIGALYKSEASKNISSTQLMKLDGNPLKCMYVEFVELFKVHIHDKPHLSDKVRMIQLEMLNALLMVLAPKEQFSQLSVIARACISKLTEGEKLLNKARQALQELSFDVVNCAGMLKLINHSTDVSASDNL